MKSTAAIHVAKKQLNLDDDTYRALNLRIVGKPSSKDMTEPERQLVLDEMRRQGFKPVLKGTSKATRKQLEGKFAPKLQALWIACWNLGIIRNKSDQALIAFVKRQAGVDHTRFLIHADDGNKAIEGLKGWMSREANVHWAKDKDLPAWGNEPHGQIVLAQWAIMRKHGLTDDAIPMSATIWPLCGHTGRPILNNLKAHEWQLVMNEFGKRVRKCKS